MKSFTTRMMIAVAALAVAAGTASAQTYKAEIPMAFHAGNKAMTAGSYDLRMVRGISGHPFVAVQNVNTKATAVLLPVLGPDAPKAWVEAGNPRITFECVDGSCSLRKLWNGRDAAVYQLPARKLRPAEVERIAVVTVGLTKAD